METAEAEAAAAEDLANAARAKAEELRRMAGKPAPEPEDATEPVPGADTATGSWRRRITWRAGVCALSFVLSAGVLGLSGYLVWHHRESVSQHQQVAEYEAAARQIVVTLMSLDKASAPETVKTVIDSSTGQFKSEFEGAADDFVAITADADVTTKAQVKAAAVQSISHDQAQVLVTVTSTVSNAAGADQPPRSWRLTVSLVREGDRIKMSQLEFVP
ncbi:hypothetical protein [Mycolicibacterium sp. P9-64]|uniref:hypothetical protein n=1 Tax=Mycolicibacterium sp. P9-64 TaxID=2024612 RepID=UPI001F5BAF90|nr:hypothetical protein [Mycolicibacterium sp. P9-64]